jgi:hypothetical protein
MVCTWLCLEMSTTGTTFDTCGQQKPLGGLTDNTAFTIQGRPEGCTSGSSVSLQGSWEGENAASLLPKKASQPT